MNIWERELFLHLLLCSKTIGSYLLRVKVDVVVIDANNCVRREEIGVQLY